jgi:hypothetical protein
MSKTHRRGASLASVTTASTASGVPPSGDTPTASLASHSRTPSTVEDPVEDVVLLCDKAAFLADLVRLPAPKRFKTAGQCAKHLEKLVRRSQRIILLVNSLEIEALLPLVQVASAPMVVIVHGNGSQRYKSAQVFPVNTLEEAVEIAESRLSERVFMAPAAADIRENLDIPGIFWLDDNAPRNGPDALVYDTAQKAIQKLERQMLQWHNKCGHCVTGKRCAKCNEAYFYIGTPAKKAQAEREPWLGETRRALVSSHLAPPLLEYLGRFPKGSGPFFDIAVYGSEAVAFSTHLPLRTFSSFEAAAEALHGEAAEAKEEASSTGSTHTPEPAHAQPDSSEYSDLSRCETIEDANSDVMSVASFADTDESLCDFRVSTPVPDDFFGPLRDPKIDFPEFHIPALDAQAQSVNSRSFHFDPATQCQGSATSVTALPVPHPFYGGACAAPICGLGPAIPMAW